MSKFSNNLTREFFSILNFDIFVNLKLKSKLFQRKNVLYLFCKTISSFNTRFELQLKLI